ncbi:TPA: dolichol monophosphate mannose synthase [Salmonella enterica]|nr:dolichol monophosphate mannose synthase [Salmonella enterica]HBM0065091.1 dolichol monophosphate mannose synthase [Salmonella enterica subsp. enterica serovar Enteritidis]EBL7773638.1 dolichol monophosphate mannose synthase [Salmonella enterica]EHB8454409.1 dolichol monophosphate mannose synthase [Salmonella enterica]HAG4414669.1 dolichol monophosphate mannose synthase [Salmonella enterica]
MKNQIFLLIRKNNKGCKTAKIAVLAGLSTYQARYYLQQLEKEGKVKRSALRRGAPTIWVATE